MTVLSLTIFSCFLTSVFSQAADIHVSPVFDGHFSDPFHVPYQHASKLHIAGTTHQYLVCDAGELTPGCAHSQPNDFRTSGDLNETAHKAKIEFCGAAGIHPFQSSDGSWDALVTFHVVKKSDGCKTNKDWAVIVHARPETTQTDHPPSSWIGDKIMIGDFATNVDANYDGKYFQTSQGELYLVYQKQLSKPPKRDGIVAWPMVNPMTLQGDSPVTLLQPNQNLNSENYVHGDDSFRLVETGNIHAIDNKFLMAYSVGAFDRKTYKIGIAWSDTFIPGVSGYRKVLKKNPHHLWNSKAENEVYYLLQADQSQKGWHYIADQVLAPGVPTVAQIGMNNQYVLLFAGYNPEEKPDPQTNKFKASHRRPFFIKLDVNVPKDMSVEDATDEELQTWITPHHSSAVDKRSELR